MTTDQTPGGLLRQARQRCGYSARRAAALANVSEALWRQTELGYRAVAKGVRVPVNTGRDRLQHMAEVVGADVAAVIEAAGYDASTIDSAPKAGRSQLEPWQPPSTAHRMTLPQRRAIEHLISVMTSADDRPMNEQSSADEVGRQRSLAVRTDRFTSSNNETVTQADAGELVPQSDAEREYVDTLSDAALDRLRARLLGE